MPVMNAHRQYGTVYIRYKHGQKLSRMLETVMLLKQRTHLIVQCSRELSVHTQPKNDASFELYTASLLGQHVP